jgi:hypothetical protein
MAERTYVIPAGGIRKKPPQPPAEPPAWRRRWLGRAIVIAAVGTLGWLIWLGVGALRGDPNVAKAVELRDKLLSEQAKDMSRDERRELWGQYRDIREQLTPKQRYEMDKDRNKSRAERLHEFFQKTPEEQAEELNRIIDRMEERRRQWAERGGGFGGGGPGGGPGGGGQGGAQGANGAGGGGAGQGQGQNGGRWGGGGGNGDARRRDFLDSTTPQERAEMGAFREMMRQAMQQRGINPGGGRGGWGGPGGFGGGPGRGGPGR